MVSAIRIARLCVGIEISSSGIEFSAFWLSRNIHLTVAAVYEGVNELVGATIPLLVISCEGVAKKIARDMAFLCWVLEIACCGFQIRISPIPDTQHRYAISLAIFFATPSTQGGSSNALLSVHSHFL